MRSPRDQLGAKLRSRGSLEVHVQAKSESGPFWPEQKVAMRQFFTLLPGHSNWIGQPRLFVVAKIEDGKVEFRSLPDRVRQRAPSETEWLVVAWSVVGIWAARSSSGVPYACPDSQPHGSSNKRSYAQTSPELVRAPSCAPRAPAPSPTGTYGAASWRRWRTTSYRRWTATRKTPAPDWTASCMPAGYRACGSERPSRRVRSSNAMSAGSKGTCSSV